VYCIQYSLNPASSLNLKGSLHPGDTQQPHTGDRPADGRRPQVCPSVVHDRATSQSVATAVAADRVSTRSVHRWPALELRVTRQNTSQYKNCKQNAKIPLILECCTCTQGIHYPPRGCRLGDQTSDNLGTWDACESNSVIKLAHVCATIDGMCNMATSNCHHKTAPAAESDKLAFKART
jgi:hypothetical protein